MRLTVILICTRRTSVYSSGTAVLCYLFQLCLTVGWLHLPASCHPCEELTKYGRKTANCYNKQLTAIPKDLEHDIQVLNFKDNLLTKLERDEFLQYPALQDIILVRNKIDEIAPDAFRGLTNIQFLNLEGNKLARIPSNIFDKLGSLRRLNLKSNQLMFLTKDAFSNLKSLEEIDFENCWLTRIHHETFKGLTNLKEINLVNNELMTLDPRMKKYLPDMLSIFRLYRNPWVCDCNLRWLKNYLDVENIEWNFVSNIPTCAEPDILEKISWDKLSIDKFSCPAQIVMANNVSTSIKLEIHGNLTIECIVRGDPPPTIEWKKGEKFVNPKMISKRECTGEDGKHQLCSTVTFNDLQPEDAGDYKCIARNNAGRSDTTYKLWVHNPTHKPVSTIIVLSTETLVGIIIGAVVLILLVAACIVWMVKRHDHHNRPACKKTHNYKKQAQSNGNGQENHSPNKTKVKPTCYQVDEEEESAITEVKEKDKTTRVTVNSELVPINNKTPDPITEIKPPTTENHVKPTKNNDFKMKIFQADPPDERNHKDKSVTILEPSESTEKTPLCNSTAERHGKGDIVVDMGVPDVVQRAEDKRTANHRVPQAPPNVQISNHITHITQTHKRAEENPYAKPSDMKPTTHKQDKGQASKDKKWDNIESKSKDSTMARSKVTDLTDGDIKKIKNEVQGPSQSSDGVPDKRKVTTFAPESSPCKNPVCQKDTSSNEGSRSQSPIKKSTRDTSQVDLLYSGKHIKNSQSMGGLHTTIDTLSESTSPTGGKSNVSSSQDRYRTLPNKPKVYSPMDDSRIPTTYCKSRKQPQDDYSIPSTRYSVGHHYSGSGAHIELPRPAKTATIATSPRQLPPILRNAPHHEPQIYGFQPSLPPDPIPAHIRSKTLTPRMGQRSSTGSHGDRTATSSPSRKTPKAAESTSLDDLLSPPFGHIQVERPKSPRTQAHKLPKPGDQDEYGTAV